MLLGGTGARRPFKCALAIVLCAVLFGCDAGSGQSVSSYLESAEDLLSKKDLRAAVLQLKNAIKIDPKHAQARILLASAYIDLHDPLSAQKELAVATELGGPKSTIHGLQGRAWLLTRDYSEILLNLDPSTIENAKQKAEILTIRGQAYLANATGPDRSRNLFHARQELLQALDADESSVEAKSALAYLALAQNEVATAKALYEEAAGQSPESPSVLRLAGALAFRLNEFAKGEEAYRTLVDQAPHVVVYRITLAWAHLRVGKWDDAIGVLDPILSSHANLRPAAYLRSLASFGVGDLAAARDYAERSINASPTMHLPSLLLAGSAHYALGNAEVAHRYLSRFQEEVPDFRPVGTILQDLDTSLSETGRSSADPVVPAGVTDTQQTLASEIGAMVLNVGNFNTAAEFKRRLFLVQLRGNDRRGESGWTTISTAQAGQVAESSIEPTQTEGIEIDGATREALAILELLVKREFDQAIERATRHQELNPELPDGFNLEGLAHLGLQDVERATEAFNRALEVKPGNPDASNNLAVIAAQQGDLERARALYRSALEANPGHSGTYLKFAEFEFNAGQELEAIDLLEQAVEADPAAAGPRVALARILLNRGALTGALQALAPIREDRKDDPAYLEVLGQAYLRAANWTQAVDTLQSLIGLSPEHVGARYSLAIAYEQLDEVDLAMEAFEQAMELDPHMAADHATEPGRDVVEAKVMHARLLFKRGERDLSLALLEKLKSAYPHDVRVLELDVGAALESGDPDRAADSMERIYGIRESNLNLVRLHNLLVMAGRARESVARLEAWREVIPDDVLILRTLGDHYLDTGDLARAEAAYAEAVDLEPNHSLSLNNLAVVKLQQGDHDQALGLAERAMEISPNTAVIEDTLGLILLARGDAIEATKMFEAASARSENDTSVRFHLAQALAEAGRKPEAIGILKDILAKDSEFDRYGEVKSLLTVLEQ